MEMLENITYISFLELVPVGGGISQKPFASVALRAEDVQENISISTRSHLIPRVHLHCVLDHCNAHTSAGDDRSINHATILSTYAGHQTSDIRNQTRRVILYSVQCYALHGKDNKLKKLCNHKSHVSAGWSSG